MLEFYNIGISFSSEIVRQCPPMLSNRTLLLSLYLLVHLLVLFEVVYDELAKCELCGVLEGFSSAGLDLIEGNLIIAGLVASDSKGLGWLVIGEVIGGEFSAYFDGLGDLIDDLDI